MYVGMGYTELDRLSNSHNAINVIVFSLLSLSVVGVGVERGY